MENASSAPRPAPIREDVAQVHAIRALAMIGIFLHHLFNGIPSLGASPLGAPLAPTFQAMALGVVVFNIMAGFVLARQHFGPAHKALEPYPKFMGRRLARLYPLYGLCLLVFLPANLLVFGLDASGLFQDFLLRIFFLQSFSYQAIVSNTAAWWWLSLLVQFSLLYPLVLTLFDRLGSARGFAVVAVGCWGLGLTLQTLAAAHPDSSWPHLAYMAGFNIPLRLPEFALGMWLAEAWLPGTGPIPLKRPYLLFCLGLSAVALLPALSPAGLPLLPYRAFATIAVFMLLYLWPAMERLGHAKWARWLSAASYGIYLTHQPILSYIGFWLPPMDPLARFGLMLVLGGAASVAVAHVLELVANKFTR